MARASRTHRVTFRVTPDLAAALQALPNQTAFVEAALRDALARACPLCSGRGQVALGRLRVSDFRTERLPRLSASAGRRLREVVRLGKRVWATDLDLRRAAGRAWNFRLLRRGELVLAGRIDDRSHELSLGEPSRPNRRRETWRR